MEKIMGLDLGSKTLGIAVSDALGMIAHGIETFRFPNEQNHLAVKRVKELCEKENIHTIVLGLPKHMNGDVGIRGEISIDFKSKLEKAIEGIKVILVDERLTTKVAESSLIFADVSRKKESKLLIKWLLLQFYKVI